MIKTLQRLGETRWVLPTVTFILFLVIWEVLVLLLHVRPFVLPRPSDVVATMISEAPMLLAATWATAGGVVFGLLLSIAIGVPLAILLVSSTLAERSFFPLILGAQLVPKVGLAPVITVWLGLGTPTKITVAFLLSFFPILIDTMIGLKSVELGKIQLAKSMGASRADLFFRIRLPSALPFIFAGTKVASTLAVVGTIVGEFVGARAGLGNVLLVSISNFDTVTMFAAIMYLTFLGMLIYFIIDALEKFVIPWHVSQRHDEISIRTAG